MQLQATSNSSSFEIPEILSLDAKHQILSLWKVLPLLATMCGGGANNWPATQHQILSILISLLISSFCVVFSPGNACVLVTSGNSSSMHKSDCDEGHGNRGGFQFLNKRCCPGAFQKYVYGLGVRANKTGQIFFTPEEQRNCFIGINSSFADMLITCGTEKLTENRGGCSNFSVNGVNYKLGNVIRKFTQQCHLSDEDETWEQSCGSCLNSWKKLDLAQLNDDEFMEGDPDLCRLSVMVTLISVKIDDEVWVDKLFNCLGTLPVDDEDEGEGSGAEVNAENKKRNKSGLSIRIAGVVVGVLMVLLAVSVWMCLRTSNHSDSNSNSIVENKKTAGEFYTLSRPKCLKIPIKEVYSATNNLHPLNFIGEGTAGRVYRGLLSNNQQAAIKHLIDDEETFMREVRSLSHVRHPNLVSLLGYCENEGECFLVYELCPNGNLSEWLFGQEDKLLSWIQRIKIAIDSARGLCFLHTYSRGCIVHRDIKPTNILLGANFEAKLSDFGLSKVIELDETNVSSEVRGTFGYVDPEYQNNRRVNSAGDVYSFGIVLLQMLSGRKVINIDARKPRRLDKTAKSLTREGRKFEFADPGLEGEYSAEAFEFVLELALSCTSPARQLRPSMEQVVVHLEEALHLSTMAGACTPVATPYRGFISQRH